MLRPGERIGDWIVEGTLGEGGMGAVYRVHSALTQRLVAALKVMKPSSEPDARTRFIREAEALASLRHPAVVRVMEFAEDEARGLVYLVMELAVGETLRHRIARGPMNLREAIGTFLPLAQGLDHAHSSGVFHRDIKPSNIILCDDGTVRLVDFGIAAAHHAEPLTNTGQLGTLAYLPPEVFKAEKVEPPTVDVYAFGLLLHEAMTGVRTFPVDPNLTPAAAAAAVGVRKLQAAPMELPEHLPEKLRDLVRRATSPDPAVRPTMREVRSSLETLVERRGAADVTPQHGRLVPLLPVGTQTDEHTMRVPDPTDKPVASGAWAGVPRKLLVGGALAALLLGGGAALVARGPDHDPVVQESERVQPAGRGTRPTSPPRTGASGQFPGGFATPAPVPTPAAPGTVYGASPEPSAVASPGVEASSTPQSGERAAGGASAPPQGTPAGQPAAGAQARATASPRPRLWVSPTPQSAQPAEGGQRGSEEDDDDTETVPVEGGVAGRWELTHEIEATSHAPYSGLRVGYRLNLQQDGSRVYGYGRKYSENGVPLPAGQRTSISVEGRLEGQYLVLDFVEQGAWRSSVGTIRWLVSPGAGAMQGRFASDAAQSSGTSVARRVR